MTEDQALKDLVEMLVLQVQEVRTNVERLIGNPHERIEGESSVLMLNVKLLRTKKIQVLRNGRMMKTKMAVSQTPAPCQCPRHEVQ